MRSPRERTTNFMLGLGRQQPLHNAGTRTDNRLPEVMAPNHRALVLEGLEAVRNGDIATEAEVESFFARYRV